MYVIHSFWFLLFSVSKWTPFSAIPSTNTKELCIDSISALLNITCGLHRPDSMLDFLDPTVHSANKSVGDTVMPPPLLAVMSTTTAACAIEVCTDRQIAAFIICVIVVGAGMDRAQLFSGYIITPGPDIPSQQD